MLGMTLLLEHWFHISPALSGFVLNAACYALGWKLLGGHTLVSSLFAMAATSILVDLIAAAYTFPPMDSMLASVFGGLTLGVALGMIFSRGATTGGTDLVARLLKIPFAWLPVGKLLLLVDLSMLLAVAAAFRSLESGM